MSIRGDSVILRNGRSTSEVSIYDYPEHLNPFYEDENHKRIRFWKIGKNKNRDGEKSSRRPSFSFNGIKEMWAFKSFRPKKRSSTLGVNKTSESPPKLTRELDVNETNYGTLDSRMRYSTGLQQNGNFERNAPYRSSLQDMRSPGVVSGYQSSDFARNVPYRSTIQTPTRMIRFQRSNLTPVQVPQRRYVYGGSVTPTPNRSNNFYSYDDSGKLNSRGSSQLSVASTNPFEDEDEENNNTTNLNATWHGEQHSSDNKETMKIVTETGSLQRTARKKRRAPPPPPPAQIPKVIEEEQMRNPPTSTSSEKNVSVTETSSQLNQTQETIDISNLTAEIETFVSQTDNDDEIVKPILKPAIKPKPTERKLKKVEIVINEDEPVTRSHEFEPIPNKCETVIVKTSTQTMKTTVTPVIINGEIKDEDFSASNKNNCSPVVTERTINENPPVIILENEEKILNVESPDNSDKSYSTITDETIKTTVSTPVVIKENEEKVLNVTTTSATSEQNVKSTSKRSETLENGINNRNDDISKEDFSNIETEQIPLNFELKITESIEDISEMSDISNETVGLRYIHIKDEPSISNTVELRNHSDSIQQSNIKEVKLENNINNTIGPRSHFADENLEHPLVVKPERKSVRDIIESINKNQRLLKINNDATSKLSNGIGSENYNLNESELKGLDESQKDFKRMLDQLDSYNQHDNNNNNKKQNTEDVDSIITKIDKLNSNGSAFEKCSIRKSLSRESSPTTSNLDWNPVPKPKRTKKLNNDLTRISPTRSDTNDRLI